MNLRRIDGTPIIRTRGQCAVVQAIKRGLDLTDASFDELDLRAVDFTGVTLYNAEFRHCQLDGANFTGANLRKVDFFKCKGELLAFHGADMDDAAFRECKFSVSDFSGAQMSRVRMASTYLTDCTFHRVRSTLLTLNGTRFTGCTISDTKITGGTGTRCRFTGCSFTGSDLGKFVYSVSEFVDCTCNGWAYDVKMRQPKHSAEAEAKVWVEMFAELRKEHGYTLQYVADAICTSRASLSHMESGHMVTGDINKLIGLMRLYKLSLNDLYRRVANKTRLGVPAG